MSDDFEWALRLPAHKLRAGDKIFDTRDDDKEKWPLVTVSHVSDRSEISVQVTLSGGLELRYYRYSELEVWRKKDTDWFRDWVGM